MSIRKQKRASAGQRPRPEQLCELYYHNVLCCSPTAEGETSAKRVAVRRSGAAANCAAQRAAYVVMEKFSGRGLRGTQRCECRCGPPRGRGCGPHSPADCNMLRHATERERGLASQTKDFSVEIPFIFLFGQRKMWNDADGTRFFVCCSPTAVGVRQQSAAMGRRRTARF